MELKTARSSGWRPAYVAVRELLIAPVLCSALFMSGCATKQTTAPQPTVIEPRQQIARPQPTLPAPPPRPTVTLITTTATTYYSVHATTTSSIFEEIKAQGLREQDGELAMGLASANSEMEFEARETGALSTSGQDLCTPESVTIKLDLVVTLPRHERVNDLSDHLRERWHDFTASVAAHEQRHVDIFMNGASAVKARIEAALSRWMACVDLEATLRRVWKAQEIETARAQREFDVADRVRIAHDRKPLQAVIDTGKARLAAVNTDVRQLDASLADLSRRASVLRQNIDAVKAEIAKSNATCARPTNRVQALCRQYKALATSHDALVAEHSSLLVHRNGLADEHNVLVERINGLIEAINWVY